MRALLQLAFCTVLLLPVLSGCKKDQVDIAGAVRMYTGTGENLNRITFLDSTHVLVAGGDRFRAGFALASADGGRTFSGPDTIPTSICGFYGIGARPDGTAWMCAFGGAFGVTHDYGASWAFVRGSQYSFVRDVAMISDTTLLCITTRTDDSGKIWRMNSDGYMDMRASYRANLNRLLMISATTGYACGGGRIAKTTDGGQSWQELVIEGDNFTSLCALGESNIYACGQSGSIVASYDAGQSWHYLRNGSNIANKRYWLSDLCFVDADHGYAVGEAGAVLYTDDRGEHWMELKPFSSADFRAIAPCPDGALLVCGEGGELWRINP